MESGRKGGEVIRSGLSLVAEDTEEIYSQEKDRSKLKLPRLQPVYRNYCLELPNLYQVPAVAPHSSAAPTEAKVLLLRREKVHN